MYDLILRNYSNVDFVLELDYVDSVGLIRKLRDDEDEAKLWDRYIAVYPLMAIGMVENASYNDYRDQFTRTGKYKRLTKVEIYKDVDSIIEGFKIPKKKVR